MLGLRWLLCKEERVGGVVGVVATRNSNNNNNSNKYLLLGSVLTTW